MLVSKNFGSRVAAVAAAAALLLVVGCSDNTGLGKRYPVAGTVKLKGQPVEKGTISFQPNDAAGRPAAGEISNGSYRLTTLAPNDGALPGSYKVTVTAQEMDTTELKEVAKGGQFHHDEKFAKAVANAKNLVPSKYRLADTSGLTADVKEQSNSIDFDLDE